MRLVSTQQSSRTVQYVLAALLGLGLILRVLSAAPTWIHYDENYYLNISQNYILRGELTPYMWRLDADTNIIAGSGTGYGIYLLVGWMKLTGLSLFGGRLLMIGISLATACVMYAVAARWWQSRLAGVVALVFGIVSTSPFYSFVIRMDAPGMLAYSLVLLLHIHAVRQNRRWLHFATGAAVVASVEFHILGLLYMVALTAWYLLEYAWLVVRERRLVLNVGPVYFGVGGFIAGCVYILVHIAPDPAAYFAIPSNAFYGITLMKELIRYARVILLRPIEFALLVFSVISALRRRCPEDQHWLVLTGTWLLAICLTGFSPTIHYTYHVWPLIAVGTAGFIVRGMGAHDSLLRLRLRFGAALVIMTLLLNIGLHLINRQPFELRKDVEISPKLTFVREAVPPDTVVMGDVEHYFYLMDYPNFMSYRDTDSYIAAQRGESQLDYWRRLQPLVILRDEEKQDPELMIYIDEMQLVQVGSGIWVAPQFASQPA